MNERLCRKNVLIIGATVVGWSARQKMLQILLNPGLKSKFDDIQLSQINKGKTPEGFVWHHDAETGKMQLVDRNIHEATGHTGGRTIWGGGQDAR